DAPRASRPGPERPRATRGGERAGGDGVDAHERAGLSHLPRRLAPPERRLRRIARRTSAHDLRLRGRLRELAAPRQAGRAADPGADALDGGVRHAARLAPGMALGG